MYKNKNFVIKISSEAKITFLHLDRKEIEIYLQKGGILFYPTDTIYGIFTLYNFIDRIFKTKERNEQKPIAFFVHKLHIKKRLSSLGINFDNGCMTLLYKIIKVFLPGVFTVILKVENTTYGLRSTEDRTLNYILKNNTICGSSVNKSGKTHCVNWNEVLYFAIKNRIESMIVTNSTLNLTQPSIIVFISKIDTRFKLSFDRVNNKNKFILMKKIQTIKKNFKDRILIEGSY